MPSFATAYLIHGDDHGRIGERRAKLRSLAEAISGAEGLELFEGDAATPATVAAALDAMTLAMSRRFLIVDGTETWKDKDLDGLEAALGALGPGAETTVTFFAREEGRSKLAPERLHTIVAKVGGKVESESNVKPWELPKWVLAQASALGVELEPDGARALIHHVGERQQRLLRELEKLALGAGEGAQLDAAEVEELSAPSAERKAWAVADALVAGDREAAVRTFLALRAHGERLPGLLYWISSRVRTAHEVAAALDAGEAPAQIKRRLRMPSRAADRLIADARRAGTDRLRQAVVQIADLELASRGGGQGGRSEDTAALVAIGRIAA